MSSKHTKLCSPSNYKSRNTDHITEDVRGVYWKSVSHWCLRKCSGIQQSRPFIKKCPNPMNNDRSLCDGEKTRKIEFRDKMYVKYSQKMS